MAHQLVQQTLGGGRCEGSFAATNEQAFRKGFTTTATPHRSTYLEYFISSRQGSLTHFTPAQETPSPFSSKLSPTSRLCHASLCKAESSETRPSDPQQNSLSTSILALSQTSSATCQHVRRCLYNRSGLALVSHLALDWGDNPRSHHSYNK